jgi:hypothetical protein
LTTCWRDYRRVGDTVGLERLVFVLSDR